MIVNHDRPTSSPARVINRQVQSQQYNLSELSSVNSTRNTSPVSLISSSASSSNTSAIGGVENHHHHNNERWVLIIPAFFYYYCAIVFFLLFFFLQTKIILTGCLFMVE